MISWLARCGHADLMVRFGLDGAVDGAGLGFLGLLAGLSGLRVFPSVCCWLSVDADLMVRVSDSQAAGGLDGRVFSASVDSAVGLWQRRELGL